jgi:virginiamycin A acetyltransferase
MTSVKSLVRQVLLYAGAALLTPLWLPCALERRLGRGKGCFAACSELLSLVPGWPGILARRSFYRMTLDRCAADACVGFGTTFAHPDAELHAGVWIGSRCTVGKVVFEPDVMVGSNVDLLSGRHQHHFDRTDRPIQDQGGRFSRVRIGRNSWLGNSSVVMADVGEQCVVGAATVVVKPLPPRCVAVGNPAAVVKTRAA